MEKQQIGFCYGILGGNIHKVVGQKKTIWRKKGVENLS